MPRRVLVTGGTGSIGVPLVRSLLAQGDTVYVLARKPHERVEALFGALPNLHILDGDVVLPDAGLSAAQLDELSGSIDVIVHGAAIVQYHWSMHEKMQQVNVGGTRNMLALCSRLKARRFLYVSTAYVAGKRAVLRESDWGRTEDAQNPYELTKQEAEQLVANFSGADVTILRLGTVIGCANTGETAGFGGYYGFVQAVWIHRERLLEYREHPVHVGVNPDSTLNLVTAEWVNKALLAAIDAKQLPVKVLHLTNPEPPSMRFLFTSTFHDYFDMPVEYEASKVSQPPGSARAHKRWQAIQRAISGAVKYFGNYVQDEPQFVFDNLQRYLGISPPPRIDKPLLERVLSYAEAREFGR